MNVICNTLKSKKLKKLLCDSPQRELTITKKKNSVNANNLIYFSSLLFSHTLRRIYLLFQFELSSNFCPSLYGMK